ncbi:MAG: LysM peptidoglycan-binding domain-containing protein [Zetaproteobacteria bacterium]|nr:LysM peptidoglycan-binding domain-containing protein [Zetaproteobacteria bacterium]
MRRLYLGCLWISLIWAVPLHAEDEDLFNSLPEQYVVKQGDTLWEITQTYFGDPMKWMDLWSRNAQIVNPHLIYPGNIINLREIMRKTEAIIASLPPVVEDQSAQSELPVVVVVPEVVDEAYQRPMLPVVEVDEAQVEVEVKTLPVDMRSRDIILHLNDQSTLGEILDVATEPRFSAEYDQVVVQMRHPVAVDDCAYDVYRHEAVIENRDDETLGVVWRYIGTLKMLQQSQGLYRAQVLHSLDGLLAGDILRLSVPQSWELPLAHDIERTAISEVMYALQGTNVGTGQHLVLLGGHDHHLQMGDRFRVVRPVGTIGNGVDQSSALEEILGHIVVTQVFDSLSFAVVNDATKAIVVGDQLRLP